MLFVRLLSLCCVLTLPAQCAALAQSQKNICTIQTLAQSQLQRTPQRNFVVATAYSCEHVQTVFNLIITSMRVFSSQHKILKGEFKSDFVPKTLDMVDRGSFVSTDCTSKVNNNMWYRSKGVLFLVFCTGKQNAPNLDALQAEVASTYAEFKADTQYVVLYGHSMGSIIAQATMVKLLPSLSPSAQALLVVSGSGKIPTQTATSLEKLVRSKKLMFLEFITTRHTSEHNYCDLFLKEGKFFVVQESASEGSRMESSDDSGYRNYIRENNINFLQMNNIDFRYHELPRLYAPDTRPKNNIDFRYHELPRLYAPDTRPKYKSGFVSEPCITWFLEHACSQPPDYSFGDTRVDETHAFGHIWGCLKLKTNLEQIAEFAADPWGYPARQIARNKKQSSKCSTRAPAPAPARIIHTH